MPQGRNAPSRVEIEAQRDRILASSIFTSSPRMQQFLDHIVKEFLANRAAQLNETAIAIDVFKRDETFDSRLDSVVRVEAGRLRTKLREYYAEIGSGDPVRIEIPKGGYAPIFSLNQSQVITTPIDRPKRIGSWALGLSLVAAAAVMIFLQLRTQHAAIEFGEPGIQSVAVLPLRDWSSSPQDYFSESMTDVLITKLAEKSGLRVTALGSVLPYKDSELSPSEIASRLGVNNLIEGGVLRESGNVRITANFIDVANGENVWSGTYTRPMTDVLALQDEIATEIATNLGVKIMPGAEPEHSPVEPLAYEAFLKGTYWRNRLTENGFNRGIIYFQEAIALQPDYAQAYAGLAACHCQLGGHGIEVVLPDVAMSQARYLAKRALELDGSLAEPNAVLGIISFKYEWDPEKAERHLLKAIERNPSLFEAYLWRSQIAEAIGEQEFAMEQARLATTINPLSLSANMNLGWQLFQAGDLLEAELEFRDLIDFDPNFWGGHWGLGHVLREHENYDEAIMEFERAVELGGGHTLALAALGYTYAKAGRRASANSIIEELNSLSQKTYISPFHIAMIYAGLSDADAAFEYLERAMEVRARSVPWLAVTRELDSLRDDPRYDRLTASIGIHSP